MGKTISVDFDGVLHKYSRGRADGSIYDDPMPEAQKAIKLLQNKGFKVVVFTARKELEDVKAWMDKHEFPECEITNIKSPAFCYVDDRAIRFTNWRDILNYF